MRNGLLTVKRYHGCKWVSALITLHLSRCQMQYYGTVTVTLYHVVAANGHDGVGYEQVVKSVDQAFRNTIPNEEVYDTVGRLVERNSRLSGHKWVVQEVR